VKPLAIDLFCGLGGWAEGFLAEGYDVIGFDIERHDYGTGGYPGQLVLQDVLTLHGSQLKDAAVIVASPPCQKYSYMAMPWTRAKKMAAEYRSGVRSIEELNALFNACFRIAKEAGVPLLVENVRGAQPWVGPARWNFGSFYLWGDIPALMPFTAGRMKFNPDGTAHPPGSWFAIADSKERGAKVSRNFHQFEKTGIPSTTFHAAAHERKVAVSDAIKNTGGSCFNVAHNTTSGKGHNPDGRDSFGWSKDTPLRNNSSSSSSRKAASAQIAKIPYPLARWIAQVFKPDFAPTPHPVYNARDAS
jgi:Site-specific DNA methylase